MHVTNTGISAGRPNSARRLGLAALVVALVAAAPAAVRPADAAEPDPIFEDGFEISGVSPWSTALGLAAGARLDIYLDSFLTLQSTEIIDVVDVDFSPAVNIAAVISGYVKVPSSGVWELRLTYEPLGELWVDGELVGGYLGSIWYCQPNFGTADTAPVQLAAGEILQFEIRYYSGCLTIVWDQQVSLTWRLNAGPWTHIPAGNLFH